MKMKKKTSNEDVMNIVVVQLQRIESKVDKLDERMDTAEKIAIKQECNLEEHMRRSDLLEQSQNELKEYVKPILKIYTVAWGICKIIAATALVVTLVSGILRMLNLV